MNRVVFPLTVISAIGIFLLSALILGSVFFRYLLNAPILWTEDLTMILLGLTVFAALPGVTLRRDHIQVDLLAALFERWPRFNRIRAFVVDFIALALIGLVAWQLLLSAVKSYNRQTLSPTVEWLLWPAIGTYALLLLLTGVAYLLRILADIQKAARQTEQNNA